MTTAASPAVADSDVLLTEPAGAGRKKLLAPLQRLANGLPAKLMRAGTLLRFRRENKALQAAMRGAGITQLSYYSWKVLYRYLRNSYLRGTFSIQDSLRIATNHYLELARHVQPDFLQVASNDGFLLWQYQAEDGCQYHIRLRYPYFYNFDGDLSFCMSCNGKNIYIVSVTIAPGSMVGVAAGQVMLVGGVQGVTGKIEEIRAATDSCNNVSPPNMLLAAIETFALKLGIQDLVGIGSAPGQTARLPRFDYSGFWRPLSGQEDERVFYHIPLPFVDKPIEAIQAKHRSRARKRRELRNIIRQQIMSGTEPVMDEKILRR